jgi:hypothetical protein
MHGQRFFMLLPHFCNTCGARRRSNRAQRRSVATAGGQQPGLPASADEDGRSPNEYRPAAAITVCETSTVARFMLVLMPAGRRSNGIESATFLVFATFL